jgi:hypothetical protein
LFFSEAHIAIIAPRYKFDYRVAIIGGAHPSQPTPFLIHRVCEQPNSVIQNFGFEPFSQPDFGEGFGRRVHGPTIKVGNRMGRVEGARGEDDLINPLSQPELGEGGTSHVAASSQFSRAKRNRSARPIRPPS